MDDQRQISRRVQPSQPTPSAAFLDALGKWMIAFTHVYRQPMTEATVWAYRETLCDLSADELNRGCTEAMKYTRFTPTPAEIREYSKEKSETPALNSAPPIAPISQQEAQEFLDKMQADIPWLKEPKVKREGVIEITDEMRKRADEKKQEALRKFSNRGV